MPNTYLKYRGKRKSTYIILYVRIYNTSRAGSIKVVILSYMRKKKTKKHSLVYNLQAYRRNLERGFRKFTAQ